MNVSSIQKLPPRLQEKYGPEIREHQRRLFLGDLTKLTEDELYQKAMVIGLFWQGQHEDLLDEITAEIRNRRVRSMCATDNEVCLTKP